MKAVAIKKKNADGSDKKKFYVLFDPGSRNAGIVTFVFNETENKIDLPTLSLNTLDIIGDDSRWAKYKRAKRHWPLFIGDELTGAIKKPDDIPEENMVVVIERQMTDDWIRVEMSFFAYCKFAYPKAEFFSYRMLDARTKFKLHGANRKIRKQKSVTFAKEKFQIATSSDHEADCFVLFAYHLSLI